MVKNFAMVAGVLAVLMVADSALARGRKCSSCSTGGCSTGACSVAGYTAGGCPGGVCSLPASAGGMATITNVPPGLAAAPAAEAAQVAVTPVVVAPVSVATVSAAPVQPALNQYASARRGMFGRR